MSDQQPDIPLTPGSLRARISAWADVVYLRSGDRAHVLPFGIRPAYPSALCGRRPALWESWYGTGSQDEIDKARGMPLCRRCSARAEGRTR